MGWFKDLTKKIKKTFKHISPVDFITDSVNTVSKAFPGLGNSLDVMDPGNTFHQSRATREAEAQFEYEQALNKQNFEYQQDVYNYQKSLNTMQMEREDDATLRRVKDLKAAGLSPTLAAGSAASSTPVHAGSVPQMAAPTNTKVQAAMFADSQRRDYMSLATSMLGNFANIARTKAETDFINAQKDKLVQETPLDLAIKYQAYEFAQNINPYKIKHAANEISLQDKTMALKDMDLILAEDVHAQNAYRIYGMELDNKLKQADIDIKDREFIIKGLAIDAAMIANSKAGLEFKNMQWDTDYYHGKNMPVGMSLGMFNGALPLFATGYNAGNSVGGKLKSVVNFVKNWRNRFKISAGDYHRMYDRY